MGDESLFDTLRGEPSSGYAPDPFLEGSLSALAFNRGQDAATNTGAHAPAAYAARQLRAALRTDGVSVQRLGRGRDRAARRRDASWRRVPSPTVAQLLGLMLPPSDNFFAEMLAEGDSAPAWRRRHDRRGGAGGRPRTIASLLGIHPRDLRRLGALGSRPHLALRGGRPAGGAVPDPDRGGCCANNMAVAGRTGTLEQRMRSTAAAGRCVGKTGTLTGVSNLVGYCPSEQRPRARLRDLHRRDLDNWRRTPSRTTSRSRSRARPSSSAQPSVAWQRALEQLEQAGFVEHRGTPRRSAFSSFEPGLSPATR